MSKSLADQAREARKRRDLTQREAAELAQVSHRAYQDFESGNTKTQPANLRRIIDALGLEAEDAERAQMTREEFPPETQVFLDVIGSYMQSMSAAERMDFIRDETRRLFNNGR